MNLDARRARNIAKRRAQEKRFQWYGIAAICVGVFFLVVLFFSIVSKGYPAFQQTYIQLDVFFDETLIDPTGDRAEETLSRADYGGLIKKSLRNAFPGGRKKT